MPAGTTAFHGDLIRDLVVNNQVSGQLRVYLGIGGGFYAAPLLLAVSKAAALGVADFNGDGHDDIAVATTNGPFGSHRAFVLFGDGLGGFPSQVVFNLGRDQISLTIADFDNNGFPDVAIAAARNDRVYILLSNGVAAPGQQFSFSISFENRCHTGPSLARRLADA